jgi:hypothetical protein
MARQLSSLLLFVILVIIGWAIWANTTPYYLHDMIPNEPMQVVIGDKAWYFPMGYIDPHYPNDHYTRGVETELWLTLGIPNYKILPPDPAAEPLQSTVDVILTSDKNPQTHKAMQEMSTMRNDLGTYELTNYNLRMKQIDATHTEYFNDNGDTRISCGHDKCTLFTTEISDVRTAIILKREYLPYWRSMIDGLAIELQPFRIKPPWTYYVTSLASTHPAGIENAPVVPEVPLLHNSNPIPIESMPRLDPKPATRRIIN